MTFTLNGHSSLYHYKTNVIQKGAALEPKVVLVLIMKIQVDKKQLSQDEA